MKKLRSIVTILFLSLILGGMTSCEVGLRTDNGRQHRRLFHRHDDRAKVIVIDKDRDHRSDEHHDN